MGEEEIDMVGLFYKLANAEQEGKDATLDRKKITMALKVLKTYIALMYHHNPFMALIYLECILYMAGG